MRSFRARNRHLTSGLASSAAFAVAIALVVAVLVRPVLPSRSVGLADAAAPACALTTTVQTTTGPICGLVVSGDLAWLGVPFAAPPVGSLRWQPPQPHPPWTDTLQATAAGPACVPQGATSNPSGSEDCLYLNVVAPPGTTASSHLPVVVHIHGGGFSGGNSDGQLVLANAGVIYVSINYRLGILGFLSNPALGANSGDYGLQDQQAALHWVKDNIAAFGGDPGNVTVEGESAGASSVCQLIASPTAAGLVQKAVIVSGQYNTLFNVPASSFSNEAQDCKAPLPTQDQADRQGQDFAAAADCATTADVASCLRSLPLAQVVSVAANGYTHGGHGTVGPTLNGSTLTQTLQQELQTGDVNRVAVIAGTSRDEDLAGAPTTEAQYEQLVQQQYGSLAPQVLALYPASHFYDPFVAFRTIAADSNGVCPTLRTDREMAKWMPVYGYLTEDGFGEGMPGRGGLPASEPGGSWHVVEWYLTEQPARNPDMAIVFSQEIASVTTFAGGGQPAGTNLPQWPQYAVGPGAASVMQFSPGADTQLMPVNVIQAIHNCGFWDKVSPQS